MDRDDRLLGMDTVITRRDFLGGVLLAAGSSLLSMPAPLSAVSSRPCHCHPWTGPGGVGDCAQANGNTWDVVTAAHRIRDNEYHSILPDRVIDTQEVYDLAVVGGGISGLSAAYHFIKQRPAGRVLLLDNHPMFGGAAKNNSFDINGFLLTGPQGSNSFGSPAGDPFAEELFAGLGLPTRFSYQKPHGDMWFDQTNYGHMLWFDAPSVGHFFADGSGGSWRRGVWRGNLAQVPLPEKDRRDLLRWRNKNVPTDLSEEELDRITYRHYLEKVLQLGPAPGDYADPVLGVTLGLGSDAVSALAAQQVGMPGFSSSRVAPLAESSDWNSFPGGNEGFARAFAGQLVPGAFASGRSLAALFAPVTFRALDLSGNPCRIRLGATVVRVENETSGKMVRVVYEKGGTLFMARAARAVVASGSWVAKHIVPGLDRETMAAFQSLVKAPVLVVNVALDNWRFLDRLGITACRWMEGFGFSCNIRRTMLTGRNLPPLSPENPAVCTFYVPFLFPGSAPAKQATQGRISLLATEFAAFERKVRQQMTTLFAGAGFDPRRDIRGIITNRWGHGFLVPEPGFFYGSNGRPPAAKSIRRPHGRITFAHAELQGHQHWLGAAREGAEAADRLLKIS